MKWVVTLISSIFICVTFGQENSAEFTKSNNLFAATAYKEVSKKNQENFLVSPFALETVLALAQSGCKDETGKEIRKALHLPDDRNKIENELKNLLPQIKSDAHYALNTANKMYVQENYQIKNEFNKKAKEIYHADVENIDFTKKTEAAKTMNTWVEKHTNNKIHNLIDSNKLTNRSRVVLLNALYLKSDWEHEFPLSDTVKQKFYKTANDVVEVDSMFLTAVPAFHDLVFKYFECQHLNAKFLELPFKGGDASMTLILPNEKDGLSALENQIDRALVPHNLTFKLVNIQIPKFKIETKIDFKEILKNLGVQSAFNKDLADLSEIAGEKGDLIISEIVQKTFIKVNEKGVEAAAATYELIAVPMSGFTEEPKSFIADHPFIFYIKIKDFIVFLGRVTNPK